MRKANLKPGLFPKAWRDLLVDALEEDGAQWDWTTLGIGPRSAHAVVIAKAPGIWAGNELISALSHVAKDLGSELRATTPLRDGDQVKPGTVITEWNGDARSILALERPFLNIASYTSGIATKTRRLVDAVSRAKLKKNPRITATRKTLPGYRDIALYAVQAGGGFCHRVSLAGGVLVKENHIAAAGDIPRAIAAARSLAPHGLKIEVEVRDEKEILVAIAAGAEAILLDNFSPARVKSALKRVASVEASKKPVIEVSGGLNEENISDYTLEGVDILSVGALTHSVQALDLSLLVEMGKKP